MSARRRIRSGGAAGAGQPPPPEIADPGRFRWIVDGHNAIFAVRSWEELQLAGRRQEARRSLEEKLEAFGRAIGSQVWVVYDGNMIERNPDAISWPNLHSEYSLPPEEADDRIRYLVERALRSGEKPLVVTSDRRTLSGSLPPGARSLEVKDFLQRVLGRLLSRPEKWEPAGMEDVEQHFLRTASEDGPPGSVEGEDPADPGDPPDPKIGEKKP